MKLLVYLVLLLPCLVPADTISIGAGGNATSIRGKVISSTAASDGQVLQYVSATQKWTPTTPSTTTVAGSTGYIQYNASGALSAESNLFWDATNNYLGVGTASPSYAFDLKPTSDALAFRVQGAGPGSGASFDLDATLNSSGGRDYRLFSTGSSNGDVGGSKFGVRDVGVAGAASYRLIIDSDGDVGIGDTSPGAKLVVAGAVRMNGATSGYIGLQSPAAPTSVTYTLPADGSANQFLYTNGSGTLGWQGGWFIDADMIGGNFTMITTGSQTTYLEMTNGTITLTPKTGSAAVGVMCSSTNSAATPSTSATTCSAGSESIGISFDNPTANVWYDVCVDFMAYCQADAGNACKDAWQLIETPTNAQTLTTQGGNIRGFVFQGSGTDAIGSDSIRLCNRFTWASTGTRGIRLMYKASMTGTVDTHLIVADGGPTTTTDRNIYWTVRRVY